MDLDGFTYPFHLPPLPVLLRLTISPPKYCALAPRHTEKEKRKRPVVYQQTQKTEINQTTCTTSQMTILILAGENIGDSWILTLMMIWTDRTQNGNGNGNGTRQRMMLISWVCSVNLLKSPMRVHAKGVCIAFHFILIFPVADIATLPPHRPPPQLYPFNHTRT